MVWHPGLFGILTPGEGGGSTFTGIAFIQGGRTSAAYQAYNQKYDASADSWTDRAVIPSPLRTVQLANAYDGSTLQYVYGAGIADTDAFDDSGNSWASKGRSNGRTDAVGCFCNAVICSSDGTDMEVYTPGNNKWAGMTDYGATTTIEGSGAAFVGTDFYHMYGDKQAGGSYGSDCRIYDETGDSWSDGTDGPSPVRAYVGCTQSGDYVYVCGGEDATNEYADCDRYSATGNSWSSREDMPVALTGPGASNLASGVIMCAYGHTGSAYTPDVNIYEDSADSWTVMDDATYSMYRVRGTEG